MAVQPIFPEPITVPGNIAEAPHRQRLQFIWQVIALHTYSVAAIWVIGILAAQAEGIEPLGTFGNPGMAPVRAAIGTLVFLIALSLVRRLANGSVWDSVLSAVLLFFTMIAVSAGLSGLAGHGHPVWTLAVAYAAWALYTIPARRDFSFVGQVEISFATTAVALGALALAGFLTFAEFAIWLGIGFAMQFYLSFDLAALMRRRRSDEPIAATADMYRDLLNFVTYAFRIAAHWRRFRPIRL